MMSVFSARPTETEAAMSNVYKGVKEAQRRSEVRKTSRGRVHVNKLYATTQPDTV